MLATLFTAFVLVRYNFLQSNWNVNLLITRRSSYTDQTWKARVFFGVALGVRWVDGLIFHVACANYLSSSQISKLIYELIQEISATHGLKTSELLEHQSDVIGLSLSPILRRIFHEPSSLSLLATSCKQTQDSLNEWNH